MRYILLVLLLAGCASTEELHMAYQAQIQVAEAQASIKRSETIVIDCSKGGCGNAVIKYTDPRDQQIIVPNVRTSNDTLVEIFPGIVSLTGWVAGAFAITKIVDDIATNAGNHNTSINQATVEGDNTLDTASTTSGDSYTQTTSSVVDRHDTIDSHDVVSSHNATAPPTVVVQPPPVLVPPSYPPVVSP